MAIVYVLSKDGKPLMPTTRCGRVRWLLKVGQALVVERKPFTIQLEYETENVTQPLYLGIDPGRTNIGMAVVKGNGEPVMLIEAETRNKEVPNVMTSATRKQGSITGVDPADGSRLRRTICWKRTSIWCVRYRNSCPLPM